MDNANIILQVLNNTIARYAKKMQEYEVEIASLTVSLLKAENENATMSAEIESLKGILDSKSGGSQ